MYNTSIAQLCLGKKESKKGANNIEKKSQLSHATTFHNNSALIGSLETQTKIE